MTYVFFNTSFFKNTSALAAHLPPFFPPRPPLPPVELRSALFLRERFPIWVFLKTVNLTKEQNVTVLHRLF